MQRKPCNSFIKCYTSTKQELAQPSSKESIKVKTGPNDCCNKTGCNRVYPETESFELLLKSKLCCPKKGCQFAAKICDIYEPLVKRCLLKIGGDFGDRKYHYLLVDATTDTCYNDGIDIQSETSTLDKTLDEEAVTVITMPDGSQNEKSKRSSSEPDFRDEDFPLKSWMENDNERQRPSIVSWHLASDDENVTKISSESIEEVVKMATEKTEEFRSTTFKPAQESLFRDIVRTAAADKIKPSISQGMGYKSTLDVDKFNKSNKPKLRCCGFWKRKKKNKKELLATTPKLADRQDVASTSKSIAASYQ